MKYSQFKAETRNMQGRGASRRLRKTGLVPAIIYGANKDAIAISLDHNSIFHSLKHEEFHTSILDLIVENQVEKVLLRDFQMHPVRLEVLHLDFQRVSEKEEVQIHIPLHFINEDISHAIKVQGAHITHVITDVEIRALPKDIPHFIEIDLKNIKAGQSLHLSDLILPSGVSLVNLLRKEDSVVVIAAGISDEVESETPAVALADIPAIAEKADKKE